MHKFTSYYDGTFDQEDFDREHLATKDQDGLMSKEDKAKLDELAGGGESTVEAANVVEDATHRFVTDEEKTAWNDQVKRSEMGVPSGVATLDESGLVPSAQLPGFVDDIIEYDSFSAFPTAAESGKIYVDTAENKSYRWSGSQYIEIPSGNGLALGETAATAYAGDKGKVTTDKVNAIVDGTTVVPKAADAATVGGFTVGVSVPADAVFTDTIYEHPEMHEASMIVESAEKRFVTDDQIAYWDAKAEKRINFPYYDEKDNVVYGCGMGITIEAAEEAGKIKIKWADARGNQEITAPEGINIYGGGDGEEDPVYYPAASITMNSGLVKYIYGGCRRGSVGNVAIVINGGSFVSGNGGVIAGGHSAGTRESVVGHAEVVINNTDNEATLVYAGGQGLSVVGYTRLVMNGGTINYLTAGGANGHTGMAEVVVNGGTIKVLQGCNRGTMGNIKMTINDGTIGKMYAGGEVGDASVTATYTKAEVIVNGGTITSISAGTHGGVESAERVFGEYVEGVIAEDVAAAMNMVKAAIKFTDVVIEGTTLVFKNGDKVVKSIDLASINA